MAGPNFHLEMPRLYFPYFPASKSHPCNYFFKLQNIPESIALVRRKPTRWLHLRLPAISLRTWFPPDTPARVERTSQQRENMHICRVRSPHEASRSKKNYTEASLWEPFLMRGNDPHALKPPFHGFAIIPEDMRKGYAKEACLQQTPNRKKKEGKKERKRARPQRRGHDRAFLAEAMMLLGLCSGAPHSKTVEQGRITAVCRGGLDVFCDEQQSLWSFI